MKKKTNFILVVIIVIETMLSGNGQVKKPKLNNILDFCVYYIPDKKIANKNRY